MASNKRWDALAEWLPHGCNITGAEVGVDAGKMSDRLLGMVPYMILYLVDRWRAYSDEERARAHETSELPFKDDKYFRAAKRKVEGIARKHNGRGVLIESDSVAAAQLFEDGSLDFVFIDGDHRYESVYRDLVAWLPKVRRGGVIGGHDYTLKPDPKKDGVRQAVQEVIGYVPTGANSTWFYRIPEQEEDLFLLFEHTESLRQEAGI